MAVGAESGSSVFSEIAFSPLILVMTFGNEPPPDNRLVDLTHFAVSAYHEQPMTEVTLPVLRLRDIYPGSYW